MTTLSLNEIFTYISDNYIPEFQYNKPRQRAINLFIHQLTGIPEIPKKAVVEKMILDNLGMFLKFLTEHFGLDIDRIDIPCGKKIFNDAESRRALANAYLTSSVKRKERRRYYCKFCDGWHLTKKALST